MKTCSKCKEKKTLDSYNKFKRAPDGLSYWCRDCFRLWEAENKERRLARQKTPEYKEMRKKWRKSHNISEKMASYHAERYREKRDEIRTKMDEWRAANLDRWNGYGRKRRAIRLDNGHEPYTLEEVWNRDRGMCGICGDSVDRALKWPDRKSLAVDHIIPIAKGGADKLDNVQISHLTCNASKRDKIYA